MKKYIVFIIFAYMQETPTGDFVQSTELQIIAENEAEAMKRAKELAPDKKFYYLRTIIEKYYGDKN